MCGYVVSIAKGISTTRVLRRELDRIESATGIRPVEWMDEMHDIALMDNSDGMRFDFEGFEVQLSCNADQYIDYIREVFPERIPVEYFSP